MPSRWAPAINAILQNPTFRITCYNLPTFVYSRNSRGHLMTESAVRNPERPDDRTSVLFAVSDEPVRQLIAALLPAEAFPYHYHLVATLSEARSWLAQHTPLCVVMTVD